MTEQLVNDPISLTPTADVLAALPPACADCAPRQRAQAEEFGIWMEIQRINVARAVAHILEANGCLHLTYE